MKELFKKAEKIREELDRELKRLLYFREELRSKVEKKIKRIPKECDVSPVITGIDSSFREEFFQVGHIYIYVAARHTFEVNGKKEIETSGDVFLIPSVTGNYSDVQNLLGVLSLLEEISLSGKVMTGEILIDGSFVTFTSKLKIAEVYREQLENFPKEMAEKLPPLLEKALLTVDKWFEEKEKITFCPKSSDRNDLAKLLGIKTNINDYVIANLILQDGEYIDEIPAGVKPSKLKINDKEVKLFSAFLKERGRIYKYEYLSKFYPCKVLSVTPVDGYSPYPIMFAEKTAREIVKELFSTLEYKRWRTIR
jgi:hypothetical protein